MTVRFLLVGEGSSDTALALHITRLLVESGANHPQPMVWYNGRQLVEKIRLGLRVSGGCDLLFVHRDSDSEQETDATGPERRRREIRDAVCDAGYSGQWVSIVPVQMTEAWLLLDEIAIRTVVGRPDGTEPIELPSSSHVETVANAKDLLFQGLLTASGTSGRRLRKIRRDLPHLRRQLLENLPVGGLLEQVPSWVRFRDDLASALEGLQEH